jgi:hypothetical protein
MLPPEYFDENENEDLLPPPSPSKRAPGKLATGANKADKTNDGYNNAIKYTNRYLQEHSLPPFEELSEQDVEADHLQNFIDNIMHWLASMQFKTHSGYLATSVKITYFSTIRSVWKGRFPSRTEFWNNEEYWKELKNL